MYDTCISHDDLDALEFQTAVLVRNLELLRRRSDFYLEVDRAGYLLLRRLVAAGPVDAVTLAAALGVDASTAGRQIARLAGDGFVARDVDPADRRRTVVTATETGIAAMEAVRRRRREGTGEMLTGWDAEDVRDLTSLLARYNRAITDRYLGPDPR